MELKTKAGSNANVRNILEVANLFTAECGYPISDKIRFPVRTPIAL